MHSAQSSLILLQHNVLTNVPTSIGYQYSIPPYSIGFDGVGARKGGGAEPGSQASCTSDDRESTAVGARLTPLRGSPFGHGTTTSPAWVTQCVGGWRRLL
jgi:hypothetical protein